MNIFYSYLATLAYLTEIFVLNPSRFVYCYCLARHHQISYHSCWRSSLHVNNFQLFDGCIVFVLVIITEHTCISVLIMREQTIKNFYLSLQASFRFTAHTKVWLILIVWVIPWQRTVPCNSKIIRWVNFFKVIFKFLFYLTFLHKSSSNCTMPI